MAFCHDKSFPGYPSSYPSQHIRLVRGNSVRRLESTDSVADLDFFPHLLSLSVAERPYGVYVAVVIETAERREEGRREGDYLSPSPPRWSSRKPLPPSLCVWRDESFMLKILCFVFCKLANCYDHCMSSVCCFLCITPGDWPPTHAAMAVAEFEQEVSLAQF